MKAKDRTRVAAAEIKVMTIEKYTSMDYKRNKTNPYLAIFYI
jgi:hypothetical protein